MVKVDGGWYCAEFSELRVGMEIFGCWKDPFTSTANISIWVPPRSSEFKLVITNIKDGVLYCTKFRDGVALREEDYGNREHLYFACKVRILSGIDSDSNLELCP